jgi:cation diffusion facilitator family transporter
MNKFPKPIQLPANVYQARLDRHRDIRRAAKIGITIRLSIVLFELIGVSLIHSSALFMDAVHTLLDICSTVFLLYCIQWATKPPDEDHPFGHGRYEPLGGLLLGLLLVVLGGVLFIQQIFQISQESPEWPHPFAWIFPLTALVLLEFSYHLVRQTAKKRHSPALLADAIHYRIDVLTSLFATVALLGAAYWPESGGLFDRLGAVCIALFMVGSGLYTVRHNLDQLMDKTPDFSFFQLVRQAAKNVKGVQGTEKIRIQSYGPDAHVDIDIEVDPQLSVALAHKISQQVRVEIQKEWPAVREVTVHIEPYYANDH